MFARRCALQLATLAAAIVGTGCSLYPVPAPGWICLPDDAPSPEAVATAPDISRELPAEFVESVPAAALPDGELPSVTVSLADILEQAHQQNPRINYARERVVESFAQWHRAESLWLPSLRAGVNYNKHEGRIQDVEGRLFDTSRGVYDAGVGTNAVGAASPAVPGVYANFHLSDALFQPQIARQVVAGRDAASRGIANDVLLQVAQAYLELLRAEQESAIAREIHDKSRRLAEITSAYAQTGQGLDADHDRAQAELALRGNDLLRATEQVRVASARLAQSIGSDPLQRLEPEEPGMVPLELVDEELPVQELVAIGLSYRPEVEESRALVCEAVARLRRECSAPLLPSLLLGVSYGVMGGGLGGQFGYAADRFDADAVAYWEIRNLGRGEAASRDEMRSRINQARWEQIATLDQVAREVVEAHAQVQCRRRQIELARTAIRAAEDSYAKNLDRIQNAEGLPLEALQSVQALAQARREYLRATSDYSLAQFKLQHALGWPADVVLAD